ncbi:MAG TPA: growth inhibitor PemK [Caulobacteraceae bacterium]
MSWPEPQPGLVIRYSYLWSQEAALGQDEGLKDRPCAIVLAIEQSDGTRVYVLPITHSPPAEASEAVELPAAVKTRLNLDENRSWVMLTETNSFVWPGPDLRPLPGEASDTVAYGFLPPALFRTI